MAALVSQDEIVSDKKIGTCISQMGVSNGQCDFSGSAFVFVRIFLLCELGDR